MGFDSLSALVRPRTDMNLGLKTVISTETTHQYTKLTSEKVAHMSINFFALWLGIHLVRIPILELQISGRRESYSVWKVCAVFGISISLSVWTSTSQWAILSVYLFCRFCTYLPDSNLDAPDAAPLINVRNRKFDSRQPFESILAFQIRLRRVSSPRTEHGGSVLPDYKRNRSRYRWTDGDLLVLRLSVGPVSRTSSSTTSKHH